MWIPPPGSLRPPGGEFTQPRAHLLPDPCTFLKSENRSGDLGFSLSKSQPRFSEKQRCQSVWSVCKIENGANAAAARLNSFISLECGAAAVQRWCLWRPKGNCIFNCRQIASGLFLKAEHLNGKRNVADNWYFWWSVYFKSCGKSTEFCHIK